MPRQKSEARGHEAHQDREIFYQRGGNRVGLLPRESLGAGEAPRLTRRQVCQWGGGGTMASVCFGTLQPVVSGFTYYCLLTKANWYMSPSPGSIFVEKGEGRIGSRYKKVVYREYTDDTFRVQKKQQPNQQHLGIMGKTFAP